MSDCISLLSTRADLEKVAQWANVSQMTHVLHTEEVSIKSAASGYLDIDPFIVPDLNCERVGVVMYHCCGTGKIHSWTDEVICHVHPHGDDTCVKLDCWDLNPKHESSQADLCWIEDPCKRLADYRKCLMKLKDEGNKTSFSFRDSSGSFTFMKQDWLKEEIQIAELACDAQCGVNTRSASYRCNNGYC